jgi:hypothetical protein
MSGCRYREKYQMEIQSRWRRIMTAEVGPLDRAVPTDTATSKRPTWWRVARVRHPDGGFRKAPTRGAAFQPALQ